MGFFGMGGAIIPVLMGFHLRERLFAIDLASSG